MNDDPVTTRLAKLEMRLRDAETARAREREEQKREFSTMLAAAKRTIEEAIAASEPLTAMKEILSLNKEQMAILRDAAEERIRRVERERITTDAAKVRKEKLENYLKILAAVTATIVGLAAVLPRCPATVRAPTGDVAK